MGDKVRAIRDFSVRAVFRRGLVGPKRNDRTCFCKRFGRWEIAADFGESLDVRKRKGVVVLIVPQDAIEPAS